MTQLPLPESTWEPREPEVRRDHHPAGVLRNAALFRTFTPVPPQSDRPSVKLRAERTASA